MNRYTRLASMLALLIILAGCGSVGQNNTPKVSATPTATAPRDPCNITVGHIPPPPTSYPPPGPTVPSPIKALRAISMVSASDGWAVGSVIAILGNNSSNVIRGFLLHYTNSQWTEVSSPTREGLNAIQMLSPSEGWAVGDNGVILHYQNGQWSIASMITELGRTPNASLDGISMVSAKEGWAVGDSGIRVHYSGGKWVLDNHPNLGGVPNLYGVSMVSTNEGWAVGLGVNSLSALVHFQSGVWHKLDTETLLDPGGHTNLQSIAMISASEGWAVGTGIWHYCENQWTEVVPLSKTGQLFDVTMVSESEGWAVGQNGIWHYSKGQWVQVNSPVPLGIASGTSTRYHTGVLFSVSMISADEGWAVGNAFNLGQVTAEAADFTGYLLLHYLNGVWSVYNG